MPLLVFLHGIFDFRLSNADGEEVWLPTASEYVRSRNRRTDKLLDPDLIVTDVIRSASCCPVFKPIVDDIERIGFTEGRAGELGQLVLFNYD